MNSNHEHLQDMKKTMWVMNFKCGTELLSSSKLKHMYLYQYLPGSHLLIC